MSNTKEISAALQELSSLTNKPNWTKRDEKRHAFLLSAVAAMRKDSGISLLDLERDEFNEEARAQGLPITNFKKDRVLTKEQEIEARGWKLLVEHGTEREVRDMTIGNIIAQLGTYTGLGSFVPTDFFNQFFKSLQYVDFLFDENSVTYIKSTNGRPLPIPLMSDTENVATATLEGVNLTEADIALTSHLTLGAYAMKTPFFICSIEAFQDVEGAATVVQLFKDFSRDRFARGAGKYLVGGSGIQQPTGLLTQLTAMNTPTVVAQGSSINDGTSATGQNTIGSDDLANMIAKLDAAYLTSPKCAWAMNMSTFATILKLKDKYGRPLVDFVNGARSLFGFPIKISPSLPNLSASTQGAIILGDWSHWATRVVYDETSGVQVFNETFAELGKVGFRLFARVDGGVLFDGDSNSNNPFVILQCHS